MLKSISQLFAQAGVLEAARNLGWLIGERVARLIFTVLVSFFVARYLGPARFGLFNYAIAIVGFGATLAGVGIDAIVRRELVRSPREAPAILAAAASIRLLSGGLCYAGLWAWLWWARPDAIAQALLGVMGLLLFQPALMVVDLWLQANLRARSAAFAQLSALMLGSALRLLLVLQNQPLLSFAVVAVVESALTAIFLVWQARRQGMRISGNFPGELVRHLLKVSWPLLLASLATNLYMRVDIVMLQHLAGEDAAGVYAAAVKISELWHFLPMAIASSILPGLLRARAIGPGAYLTRMDQYISGSAALAYGIAIPIAFAAPWLVRIAFGKDFTAAGAVLAVHAWAMPFVFLGVARGQYLVNESLTRFALLATTMGAVVNTGLNVVAIPRWGPIGAASATVISYAIATWLTSFFHPKLAVVARLQTQALLLPITGWRFFFRRNPGF